jgi:hypothetical protein
MDRSHGTLTPSAGSPILHGMSEALDDTRYVDRRTAPQPRLRFTPDAELEAHLKRFLRPEITEKLGRSGLFLYADDPIRVDEPRRSSVAKRGGIESPELSAINRKLSQHATFRSQLARRLQVERLPEETPGIALQVDVILSELLAGAVMDHMHVNPDRSVGARVSISREHLVGKQAFKAACYDLYNSLLGEGRNPGIEKIKIVHAHEQLY